VAIGFGLQLSFLWVTVTMLHCNALIYESGAHVGWIVNKIIFDSQCLSRSVFELF